jgi:hypothetical protein
MNPNVIKKSEFNEDPSAVNAIFPPKTAVKR